MVARRSRFDPLATRDRPRWLVVKDMQGTLVNSSLIAAGADLHEIMTATIRARQAGGWTVESDEGYGFVSCHKAGVRHMVAIVQVDPGEPVVGAYPPRASAITSHAARNSTASQWVAPVAAAITSAVRLISSSRESMGPE